MEKVKRVLNGWMCWAFGHRLRTEMRPGRFVNRVYCERCGKWRKK